MAGGAGSRFWPISRSAQPKQFLDILGTGKTLLQQTFERFTGIIPKENIFVFTNDMYRGLVREQLPDLPEAQIVGEPVMRNTAPCLAYASHKIAMINPKASIVVSPSDHLVMDNEVFKKDILTALKAASRINTLITLGIKPTRPATDLTYIQYIPKKLESDLYKVKTFADKPTEELATMFYQSGEFLWNTGIMVWSAQSILESLETYLPEMNVIFKEGDSKYNTPAEVPFIQNAYYQCKNIPINLGILEKASNVSVLPGNFTWSDLGTWASVYERSERDYMGNAVIPSERVIMYDSNNCMVNVPEDKLVIIQGLEDFLVAESNNTLLICHKDQEEKVKEIFADVKAKYGNEYL